MRVTVITPTYRETARLRRQAEWLAAQTLTDFEWLLLDDQYAERKAELAGWGFPFLRHLPAYDPGHRAPSAVINRGLVEARGALVHFLADYVQPTPLVLERHWELYTEFGPRVMIGGPLISALCAPCTEETGNTWPVSETVFLAHCARCGTQMVVYRQRTYEYGLRYDVGETFNQDVMRQAWWAGRNESVDLGSLIAVNGLDEDMDGRGGDSDLGTRLMNHGCRVITDLSIPAILHPHARTKREGPPREQVQVPGNPKWEARLAGATGSGNTWSIMEERDKR